MFLHGTCDKFDYRSGRDKSVCQSSGADLWRHDSTDSIRDICSDYISLKKDKKIAYLRKQIRQGFRLDNDIKLDIYILSFYGVKVKKNGGFYPVF